MRCARKIAMTMAAWLLGGSSALAADGDKACTGADQPLRPVMATHTIPPYPEVSAMTKEEGTTLLQVSIGADGVPTKASVVTSSGSLRLDAAAVDYVKSTWRWNAPVKDCQPMASETRVSIKWDARDAIGDSPRMPMITMDAKDYPEGARKRHEQGNVVIMVMVTPEGLAAPRVMTSSGFPELDAKSLEVASRWHWTPASFEGHAVTTPVLVVSVWRLDLQK
jgi:protein TonB